MMVTGKGVAGNSHRQGQRRDCTLMEATALGRQWVPWRPLWGIGDKRSAPRTSITRVGHGHRRSGDGTRGRQDTSHGYGELAGRGGRGRVVAPMVLVQGLVPLPARACGTLALVGNPRHCRCSTSDGSTRHTAGTHSCLWGQVRPGGGAGAGAGAGMAACGARANVGELARAATGWGACPSQRWRLHPWKS